MNSNFYILVLHFLQHDFLQCKPDIEEQPAREMKNAPAHAAVIRKSEWFSMLIYLVLVLLLAASDGIKLLVRMKLWYIYSFTKNKTLFSAFIV